MHATHEIEAPRGPSPGRLKAIGTAGAYLTAAAILLVALVLTTLPVQSEDDRWLRIGIIMVSAGLSVWLPLRLLAPAVLVLALAPSLTRALLQEDQSARWVVAVELGGLTFLAAGSRFLYAATRAVRQERKDTPAQPPSESANPAVSIPLPRPSASPVTTPAAVGGSPSRTDGLWLGAPSLSAADAATLLRRLRTLDAEVLRTGDRVRSSLRRAHLAPE